MSNLARNLRRGVVATFIGRYANIAVQIGVVSLLARMLDPHDFGVVAVVSVLAMLLSFMSEMALVPAIIQFRTLTPAQLAALFWLTVAAGVVSVAVFAFGAPVIAAAWQSPEYARIAGWMGLGLAFSCWSIVPLASLRRAQRFREIAMAEIAAAVLSGALAVSAALAGWGVFALVVKSVLNNLLLLVIYLWRACPALSVRPVIRGMKPMFAYAAYQFLYGIVIYFTRNLDRLLIGRFLGATSLGQYDMSYRLVMMPVTNLTHVITPALQPVYAAHMDADRDGVFLSYRKLVRLLAIGGGFIGLICVACAGEIISVMYGEKWRAAVPVFSILSLSIAVLVVLSSTSAMFQSLGRTDLLFKAGMLYLLTTAPAVLVGVYTRDLHVLSWLVDVGLLLNAVPGFYLLCRQGFGKPVSALFGPMLPLLAGIVLLTASAFGLARMYAVDVPLWLGLAAKAGVVVIAYGALLAMTGDIAFIRAVLGRRAAKPR